ncbi:GNAT family N-acetyltransferase [Halobacillus litoralis]|uniref:GNAT family N-acetyltransferase n=1 Tax=Halobacillus litoralis TaxID=45668 RepID=UPI001CD3808E|nr:GNAT family N-acetyltransferase [Halobacillus litoralis]MCA0970225.1 GNAT family N-acetyltransferase [Halobacillus litoralis]
MKLSNRDMTEQDARQIVSWRYDPPYELYNLEMNDESIAEFLDGSYKAVFDDQQRLFGFYCSGRSAQVPAGDQYDVYHKKAVDMGLGMNPIYTGCGLGFDFVKMVTAELHKRHGNVPIRLTVANFNTRAIHLYEKLGFKEVDQFSNTATSFKTMIRIGGLA